MSSATALTCLETAVRAEWVDYNGHMNDGAYAVVFSHATDALMDRLGIDATFREHYRYTLYTLETHIRYLCEAHEGDRLVVDARLLDHDAKRLHMFYTMRHPDAEAALSTCEIMLMGMDRETGRPAPFPQPIADRLADLWQAHGCTTPPEGAGRSIGIPRRQDARKQDA